MIALMGRMLYTADVLFFRLLGFSVLETYVDHHLHLCPSGDLMHKVFRMLSVYFCSPVGYPQSFTTTSDNQEATVEPSKIKCCRREIWMLALSG